MGLPTNISVQFLKILNSGATRLLDKIPSWPTNNYLADHQLTTPIPLFRPSHHHDLSGLQTIPSLPLLHLTDHHMPITQHSYMTTTTINCRPFHDLPHHLTDQSKTTTIPPCKSSHDHHPTTSPAHTDIWTNYMSKQTTFLQLFEIKLNTFKHKLCFISNWILFKTCHQF